MCAALGALLQPTLVTPHGAVCGKSPAAGTHTIRTNKQIKNDNKNDEKSSCKDPIKWRERGENLPTCLCIQSWGSIFGSRTRERFSRQSAGAGRPLPLRESTDRHGKEAPGPEA